MNLTPGPVGKTTIIVAAGTVVGAVLAMAVVSANRVGESLVDGEDVDAAVKRSKVSGFLAGAAGVAAATFVVTGSARATVLVTATTAAIGLAGRELERRELATPGTVFVGALVSQVVATYLAVR